jgi:hypothetical protein
MHISLISVIFACRFVSFAQHFTHLGNVNLHILISSSLCRMSSQEEIIEQTEGVFSIANPLDNPPERTPTSLSQRAFNQLRIQFGIAEADALLPGPNDTADRPSLGFIAVNRQMCLCGAIPPFKDFLQLLLLRLTISPSNCILMDMLS